MIFTSCHLRLSSAVQVGSLVTPIVLAVVFLFGSSVAWADSGVCLVQAARAQVGVTTIYDPAYRRLAYPGGDVAPERGVCTDVLIRAYRRFELDLQQLVHEDMRAAWSSYPQLWGLSRPDPNIDHRRVPNLATYFERHGLVLPRTRRGSDYAPGDIVTWRLTSGVPHIGVVSDRVSPNGVPLIVHNIGAGTVEEDMLFRYAITGHFRYLPDAVERACE